MTALAPLFEAVEARVTIDGTVAIDRLSLVTKGDRVLFAGDTTALLAAIGGVPIARRESSDAPPSEAIVAAGKMLVAGKSVEAGEHVASTGVAPLDPPFDPAWTALEYVAWSARLGGASARSARDLAAGALGRLGLEPLASKKLASVHLLERRAVVLAQAIVLAPEVLVAEAPLAGLDGPGAGYLLRTLVAAAEGRRAIVSVARLDPSTPEGALARTASHIAVLSRGELALDGPPEEIFAGARLYALTIRANADELRALLATKGVDLRGGPLRYAASLPAGASSNVLLAAARSVRAVVVELIPILE